MASSRSRLALTSLCLFFCLPSLACVAKVSADAEESWIALATGSNSKGVFSFLTRRTSKDDAEAAAMDACHRDGKRCTYLNSWNRGCIAATVGHDSAGIAYLGTGPSTSVAKQQCEKSGADCSGDTPAVVCALDVSTHGGEDPLPMSQAPGASAPTIQRQAPVPDVSRDQPGYRADEDEGPGDNGSARNVRSWLPAEDVGSYSTNRAHTSFVLCPDHDKAKRCFVFIDADRPGRMVTNAQLYAAKVKGSLQGGAEDTNLEFSVLLNSINSNDRHLRYQFVDLAKGTSDGHYEGLMCLGYSEEKSPDPLWESCAYVAEVRNRRTSRN